MHQSRSLAIAALGVAALAAPAAAETLTGTFRFAKSSTLTKPIANTDVEIWRFAPGGTFQFVATTMTDSNGLFVWRPTQYSMPGVTYRVQVNMKNLAAGIFSAPGSNSVGFSLPGVPTAIVHHPEETLNFSWTFADVPSVNAFNILDTIAVGSAYASARRDPRETDAIGFVRVEMQSVGPVSLFEPITGTMRLLTGMEMDDADILHEYGHLLEQRISTLSGLGGSHTGCTTSFPAASIDFGFAWVEGFADYFARAVQLANPELTGSFSALENPVCPAGFPAPPGAPLDAVELFVAAALFDIADANADGGDAYCNNNAMPGDVRVFQIFDHELDGLYPANPNLKLFAQAWSARGWDLPMLQATFATSGIAIPTPPSTVFYDFGAAANVAIFRPSLGQWIIDGGLAGIGLFGTSTDFMVPADYDGDGLTDLAFWTPADGNWHVHKSATGVDEVQQWGMAGDVPMPADYDGDNEVDFAVYRLSDSKFYIFNDGCGPYEPVTVGFGNPVAADFDGDMNDDPGVMSVDGVYTIQLTPTTSTSRWVSGANGMRPYPQDYDGDGRADFAAYLNGVWRVIFSQTGGKPKLVTVGGMGDFAVPADYDGDGISDFAAFNGATGDWSILVGGTLTTPHWGQLNDWPEPAR